MYSLMAMNKTLLVDKAAAEAEVELEEEEDQQEEEALKAVKQQETVNQ